MSGPTPGDLYKVLNTAKNRQNRLTPGGECRITHTDATSVSITVTKGAPYLNLRVPRELFGANFEEIKGVGPGGGYIEQAPFTTPYR